MIRSRAVFASCTTGRGPNGSSASQIRQARTSRTICVNDISAHSSFEIDFGAKFPKAVKKIVDDEDVLLAFYDYPAEHWIHLRTTNPIESAFATVRLRTKVTRGAGSRAAALAMTFKLIESTQERWRAVNAPHLVALVRAGARFEAGQLVEREQGRLMAAARPCPCHGSSTPSA